MVKKGILTYSFDEIFISTQKLLKWFEKKRISIPKAYVTVKLLTVFFEEVHGFDLPQEELENIRKLLREDPELRL